MNLQRINPKRDAGERAIIKLFEAAYCTVWQLSDKGLPDLLVMSFAGVFFLVEIKSEKGKLTQDQEIFFAIVRGHKAPAFIVRDAADVAIVLELIQDTAR